MLHWEGIVVIVVSMELEGVIAQACPWLWRDITDQQSLPGSLSKPFLSTCLTHFLENLVQVSDYSALIAIFFHSHLNYISIHSFIPSCNLYSIYDIPLKLLRQIRAHKAIQKPIPIEKKTPLFKSTTLPNIQSRNESSRRQKHPAKSPPIAKKEK